VIRAARAADAPAIAAVHDRARAPWSSFLDLGLLDGGEALWAGRLEGGDAVTFVWAAGGDAVRGFVCLSRAGDEDLAGRPVGEVRALYVDPGTQRSGIGTALADHAVDVRRGLGDGLLVLWVWAANAPARAFYEARGWTAEAGSAQPDPDCGIEELRYRRAI
jgi:ribosomal protein S18 acetylase RimI-like enzyme